jgi:hypothetical protein
VRQSRVVNIFGGVSCNLADPLIKFKVFLGNEKLHEDVANKVKHATPF